MKFRKPLATVLAAVFSASILLGGTMSWRSISQTARNEFLHTDTVGARLHDDFHGNATKDVYVENYFTQEDGGKPVLARIRLDEYLEVGAEAAINRLDPNRQAKSIVQGGEINDPSTWHTYVLGADTDPFRGYYALSFGGETVYMPTFQKDPRSQEADINGTWEGTTPGDTTHLDDYIQYAEGDTLEGEAQYSETDLSEELHTAKKTQHATVLTMEDWKAQGSPIGPYWVYDTDGWAYWAQAIMPGETTGLLLDGIQYVSSNDDDCFYSINVVAQFSTPKDWGDPEAKTGFYDPAKGKPPTADAAALLDQAAQALGPEAGAGWKSMDQTARNDIRRPPEARPTELLIFERQPDGTPTETPIPGTEFFLFTADGTQVGGSYTTDELGAINVNLKPGDYYFEETYPSLGFAFDQEDGKPVTHYPFTVEKKEDKSTVIVYNRRLTGPLTIMKLVHNEEAGELTQEQKEQQFTFTVTFSDAGSYPCQIDGGEEQAIPSGGTLLLRHGQTAVFPAIPVGVQYTVTESTVDGYQVSSQGNHGNITPEGQEALFTNVVGRSEPEAPVLTVTKVLAGEYPTKDANKEFHFTLHLGGRTEAFTLKNGETKTFDQVQAEDVYLITEEDAFPDGYSLTTANAAGTIMEGETKAVFTNTYVGRTQVELTGEKTWHVDETHAALIPASVPLRLYGDGLLVKEQDIRPDREGKWHYTFYAPKYTGDGKEISYTVQEAPIDYFLPTYHGNDIENTYTDPVAIAPPVLEKVVEGSNAPQRQFTFILQSEDGGPMPEGLTGNAVRLTLDGAGRLELGRLVFKRTGTFHYTLYEVKGAGTNWTYDTARYTLTFTIAAKDGKLAVEGSMTRDGEEADKLVFRNTYTSSGGGGGSSGTGNVQVAGEKHWEHGENAQEHWPEKLTVLVYANGELCCQEEVTEKDGWKYAFRLPKYDQRGKKIVYTVGEEPIEGYQCQVDGYDLINTYTGEAEPSPTPTAAESPSPAPGGVETTPTPAPETATPTPEESGSPAPTPSETPPAGEAPSPTPPGTADTPPGSAGDTPNTVKTGDTGELGLWLGVTALGGAGTLLCLGCLLHDRRRYVGKRLIQK